MSNTETNSALAIYSHMNQIASAASALARSSYFEDNSKDAAANEANALVKVMAGAELGLPPFASMTGIHIIKGKPIIGANLIATLIKKSGHYNYRVVKNDDDQCVIKFYEAGEEVGTSSFSNDDAKAAGLGGDNWRKYGRNMRFARAISNGARWYCPDIFGGASMYTPDEFGLAVDADGDVIDAEVMPADPEPEPQDQALRDEYDALIAEAYSDEERESKRAGFHSRFSVDGDDEFSNEQLHALISGLKGVIKKNTRAAEDKQAAKDGVKAKAARFSELSDALFAAFGKEGPKRQNGEADLLSHFEVGSLLELTPEQMAEAIDLISTSKND